jgi:hypothetical protein
MWATGRRGGIDRAEATIARQDQSEVTLSGVADTRVSHEATALSGTGRPGSAWWIHAPGESHGRRAEAEQSLFRDSGQRSRGQGEDTANI